MSSGMNSCNFIGTVLDKPKVQRYKYGDKITVVAYLNLSVARIGIKGKQKYDDLSLKAGGNIAENIEKYITKGSSIGVMCRAEKTKYQKNGRWYSNTLFRILQLYFLDEKSADMPEVMIDESQIKEIDLDTSALEETEYHDIDFSALD